MVSMQPMPVVGRWREPIVPELPTTEAQVAWSRCRPPGLRTPRPKVGEIVGWRARALGPVVAARILEVADAEPADTRPGAEIDWNVWRYVLADGDRQRRPLERGDGHRVVELVDDPWYDVLVRTIDGPVLMSWTREARLPGSAGWLWRDPGPRGWIVEE